ncbi:MAG: hypothetical protein KKG99_09780 [Bacteroidetes bacterium]|nr:hypothetical protein [Bacteroidota bacterium]
MKKIFIIYFVFLGWLSNAYPQSDFSRLTNNLTENIVLTTDRDIYISGEKVWFKAQGFIALDVPNNQLSNILYVELFNASNQSYVRKKFKIINGMVSGMFIIPQELNSGNYFIRAYTQYQRNSLPETFFTQVITIINPAIKLSKEISEYKGIEIFPEFGLIMNNLTNRIAINFGQRDENKTLTAWLTDENQNRVSDVSINNGLGLMQFIPTENKQYTLHTFNIQDTLLTKLPKASNEGIVMNVLKSNFSDQIDLQIISRQALNQELKLELLSSHLNKKTEQQIYLQNHETHLSIPTSSFDPGFNYFILRNNKNEILSIYCHLKPFDNPIAIKITPDKQSYKRREKIELEIEPTVKSEEFIDLSITVAKKGTINGYNDKMPRQIIENPVLLNSYLSSNSGINAETKELDALLVAYNSKLANDVVFRNNLTKFKYNLEWIPEIRDVSLSGFVINKETRMPTANAEVYASVFKNNPQVHMYKTDKDGFFIFSLNKLTELHDVYLSVKKNNITDNQEFELLVNHDFLRSYPTLNSTSIDIDSTQIPFIEELYINTQASKVFNTETGNRAKPTDNLPFIFSNPEFSLDLDNYVENPSLEVIFRELVPSVKVKNDGGKYSLTVTDPDRRLAQSDPLIMVDFIAIFDVNELMKIDPADIKKIDIYTTPFILGNTQIEGVILITTNTDNFGGIKMSAESAFFEYTTVSDSYYFDPPTYESVETANSHDADFRNLLHWHASLKVKDFKKVTFYASDHCSEYDIIIRGVTKDGKKYYGKSSIEISR